MKNVSIRLCDTKRKEDLFNTSLQCFSDVFFTVPNSFKRKSNFFLCARFLGHHKKKKKKKKKLCHSLPLNISNTSMYMVYCHYILFNSCILYKRKSHTILRK